MRASPIKASRGSWSRAVPVSGAALRLTTSIGDEDPMRTGSNCRSRQPRASATAGISLATSPRGLQETEMPSKPDAVKMPSTLKRSPAKAQRTYAETLSNAEREYGVGERASRTAYAALKHSFEKVDDHWEPKAHKGPSDPQAAKSGRAAREGKAESFGGVDLRGHTRQQLLERAARLGVRGRSAMNKQDLARAIARKQG